TRGADGQWRYGGVDIAKLDERIRAGDSWRGSDDLWPLGVGRWWYTINALHLRHVVPHLARSLFLALLGLLRLLLPDALTLGIQALAFLFLVLGHTGLRQVAQVVRRFLAAQLHAVGKQTGVVGELVKYRNGGTNAVGLLTGLDFEVGGSGISGIGDARQGFQTFDRCGDVSLPAVLVALQCVLAKAGIDAGTML